jgi:hypothetical protein
MKKRKTNLNERHAPLPPSRRGGKGGPRELSITTLWRADPNARSGGKPVPYVRNVTLAERIVAFRERIVA